MGKQLVELSSSAQHWRLKGILGCIFSSWKMQANIMEDLPVLFTTAKSFAVLGWYCRHSWLKWSVLWLAASGTWRWWSCRCWQIPHLPAVHWLCLANDKAGKMLKSVLLWGISLYLGNIICVGEHVPLQSSSMFTWSWLHCVHRGKFLFKVRCKELE